MRACMHACMYVCSCFPSGADVRPKFHLGVSYALICSGYISDFLRAYLGVGLDFLWGLFS